MIRPSNRLYLDSAKISGVLVVSIQNWSSNFLEIFSKFSRNFCGKRVMG